MLLAETGFVWWIIVLGSIWSCLAGIAFVGDLLLLILSHGRHGVHLFVHGKYGAPCPEARATRPSSVGLTAIDDNRDMLTEEDFPIGSIVTQEGYGATLFSVIGYWRGNVKLRSDAVTIHYAAPSSLQVVMISPDGEIPHYKEGL